MKKLEFLSILIVFLTIAICLALYIYQGFILHTFQVSANPNINILDSSPLDYNTENSTFIEDDPVTKESPPIIIELEPEIIVEPSKPTYYIRINVVSNTVTVYGQDENKEYTVPVKAFVCSTGTATPHSGVYATPQKFEWVDLFGSVYGQYSTQIVGHILFHSVPYRRKYDKASLIYSYYDRLGTSASAGCVRLTVEDAKWIYDNCELGTNVEFYDDSTTPGPLGKPTAQKISGNTALRHWDPTDPDENNPWRN